MGIEVMQPQEERTIVIAGPKPTHRLGCDAIGWGLRFPVLLLHVVGVERPVAVEAIEAPDQPMGIPDHLEVGVLDHGRRLVPVRAEDLGERGNARVDVGAMDIPRGHDLQDRGDGVRRLRHRALEERGGAGELVEVG